MAKKDTRANRSHEGAMALGDIPELKALGERLAHQNESPDTDGSEAALAFKRQRERENAVAEPASPAEPPFEPTRRVIPWGQTVRPWTTHGRDTGVSHVTTTSPDMVGTRFADGKHRTAAEKREMEDAGLKFFTEAQAWLKPNRDGAFDETRELAAKLAAGRREEMARERRR